ncbi:MAG: hypothetical protein RSH26_02350, partial [Clostridia bacterium]
CFAVRKQPLGKGARPPRPPSVHEWSLASLPCAAVGARIRIVYTGFEKESPAFWRLAARYEFAFEEGIQTIHAEESTAWELPTKPEERQ